MGSIIISLNLYCKICSFFRIVTYKTCNISYIFVNSELTKIKKKHAYIFLRVFKDFAVLVKIRITGNIMHN